MKKLIAICTVMLVVQGALGVTAENGITAHRGDSIRLPQNSLRAFSSANRIGVDWIETDVHLTKDCQLVISHNAATGAYCSQNKKIKDCTYAELIQLDMAENFRAQHKLTLAQCPKMTIVRLDEALDLILAEKKARLSIHPKCDCVDQVMALVRRKDAIKWVGFNDSNAKWMCRVKELEPSVPVFWDRLNNLDLEKDIAFAKKHGFETIVLFHKTVTPERIHKLKAAGFKVGAWTVNEPADMRRFLNMGVDRLYTDDPETFKDIKNGICDGAFTGECYVATGGKPSSVQVAKQKKTNKIDYALFDQAEARARELFEVGFSRADITPPIGTPLSGYYNRRVSDGVLDPLYARCLAISDGEIKALIYSVDNVHLQDPAVAEIRAEIVRTTGVSPEAVFLACTHTHTSPVSHVPRKGVAHWEIIKPEDVPFILESNRLIAERCAEAGRRALANLAPASMMIGRGEAKGISFVRRFKMKDGTVCTNPGVNNPDVECAVGTPDEQLQLVRFLRKGQKEIALVNFQCHPDTIGGTKMSADWPGLSCTYLENAMHGDVDAIVLNGAQGDTNHIRPKLTPGETVPRGYDMANHMARTVAGAALAVWGTCVPVECGKVRVVMRGVKVVPNKGSAEDVDRAEKWTALHQSGRSEEVPSIGVGMGRTSNIAAAYRILEVKDMPDEVELPVSVVTVGKTLAFCGFPGEPFTWMGTELKHRSPFTMTIPACLVNGMRDYFPVKSAYAKGGYENASSRYAAGTAERLVDGVLLSLEAMYKH